MYFRVGDEVLILAGDDYGSGDTRGKIIAVDRAAGKVMVEGVNKVYKHMRPSRRNQAGGRLSKEMPVSASNVAFIDPSSGRPTRVGVRIRDDGAKELFAKRSGATIRELSPPKPSRAAQAS